jgi:hypothetical protein
MNQVHGSLFFFEVRDMDFSGWVIRIYTNYKPENPEQRKWMCEIQCSHSHVDFCLADRLPLLGDVASAQEDGRTWRFLPGMDPLVDVFLSRWDACIF